MPPIRQIRDRLGLKQDEMAERLGMDLQNYRRWEQGRTRPAKGIMKIVKNLCVIVQPLGLNVADFPDEMFN